MTKTKKIMAGISSTAMAFALTGCGDDSADLPPVPEDNACNDWDWEADDGIWECSDEDSPYYHHYYYGGQYYRSKNALSFDDDYLKYKKSKSFKGAVKKGSSGFGSGFKSSGG